MLSERNVTERGPSPRIVPQDPDLRIRPGGSADDGFVRQLFKVTRADVFAAAQLPPAALDAMLDQQFRAQIAGYAAQFPAALSFVITREAQPVGRLLLHVESQRWQIVDIAILPEARNQGAGTDVIDSLAREARAQGAQELMLTVLASNAGARRLYARLGFVGTDATAGGSHIVMVKWLDG